MCSGGVFLVFFVGCHVRFCFYVGNSSRASLYAEINLCKCQICSFMNLGSSTQIPTDYIVNLRLEKLAS